jgi:CBS domain-containing protein
MVFVGDVMTTDIVTIDVDGSLQDAVERLLEHEVGSVVVLKDGEPAGLVTETDALEAAARTGKPLAAIPVEPLCDRPVVTTSPDRTVTHVATRMLEEGVKKFPVLDDLDIVGIVTLTDIVVHLSDIRSEAQELAEQHYDWESD